MHVFMYALHTDQTCLYMCLHVCAYTCMPTCILSLELKLENFKIVSYFHIPPFLLL